MRDLPFVTEKGARISHEISLTLTKNNIDLMKKQEKVMQKG